MNREAVETALLVVGAKQDGREFKLGSCSVVGCTRISQIDYNFMVKIFLHSDDSMGITLAANAWLDQILVYEFFSDLNIIVNGKVLTIKGKHCEFVIEKEEE